MYKLHSFTFPLFNVFSALLSTENERSHLLLANVGIIFQPFSHTLDDPKTTQILNNANNFVNIKGFLFICGLFLITI